ncbi:hypothetical protein FPQ18DRAFT_403382 [Pyronema domesticum]|uniref:Uncharacterized protein n=1 Tax=Pyronema omphalodes (strain CBS 100304) TaxID=1076935 RepID=U4LHK5_PYROM|nr:hypothetical protein FPQ18DRAFT_403382 [Pyronema domesticum]CCX31017.1 Protein of unknown function [Pyronema omphalodes CBS 100304]
MSQLQKTASRLFPCRPIYLSFPATIRRHQSSQSPPPASEDPTKAKKSSASSMYPDLQGAQGAKGAKGTKGAGKFHMPENLTGYMDIITKVGFGVLVIGAATLFYLREDKSMGIHKEGNGAGPAGKGDRDKK